MIETTPAQEIEEQDGKGNVVTGSTRADEATKRLFKTVSGEWIIGACFPIGDDGKMRVDKPYTIQIMPQGPGRITFALLPCPTETFWVDVDGIMGFGEVSKGIMDNYLQSTTGIQVASNQGMAGKVAHGPGPVRQ